MAIRIEALSEAVGAAVDGVDLAQPVPAAVQHQIEQSLFERGVLLFRGQAIGDTDLVRFSRSFGALDRSPASEYHAAGGQASSTPDVWIISNVKKDGAPIGALGDAEAEWHADMTYVAQPPMASVLYALEVPPTGGNTSFASMTAAYDALPGALKERVSGLTINHDSSYTSTGELRAGMAPVTDVTKAPGAVHPVVIVHPVTGRPALYLGRRRNAWVVGLTQDESDALLDLLWRHVTRRDFVYEHVWRAGDLLIWDNRIVIHRRDGFDPDSRRVMHRTQIKGTAPDADHGRRVKAG